MSQAPRSNRAIIAPPALAEAVAATGFSPAVRAGDLIFLTGATGGLADGTMPEGAVDQLSSILDKLAAILAAADLAADAVVEMTSFHIGLRDHFDAVDRLLRTRLGEPLPAWTALEAAGLRRHGAVLEIRFVLYAPAR